MRLHDCRDMCSKWKNTSIKNNMTWNKSAPILQIDTSVAKMRRTITHKNAFCWPILWLKFVLRSQKQIKHPKDFENGIKWTLVEQNSKWAFILCIMGWCKPKRQLTNDVRRKWQKHGEPPPRYNEWGGPDQVWFDPNSFIAFEKVWYSKWITAKSLMHGFCTINWVFLSTQIDTPPLALI